WWYAGVISSGRGITRGGVVLRPSIDWGAVSPRRSQARRPSNSTPRPTTSGPMRGCGHRRTTPPERSMTAGTPTPVRPTHRAIRPLYDRKDADTLEAEAQAVLTTPITSSIASCGERVLDSYPDADDHRLGLALQDTLKAPELVSAQASLERMHLLSEVGCLEVA